MIREFILRNAAAYRTFQNLMAKKKNLHHYLAENLKAYSTRLGRKINIVDVGCGDAAVAAYLGKFSNYVGIDISPKYIEAAQKKFPEFEFYCSSLENIQKFIGDSPVDLFLLIGVLHHLNDQQASKLLSFIDDRYPEAAVFAFDVVYLPRQRWIARLLARLDRGEFVRTPDQYARLAKGFESRIYHDLLRVPYDLIVHTKNLPDFELGKEPAVFLNKQ